MRSKRLHLLFVLITLLISATANTIDKADDAVYTVPKHIRHSWSRLGVRRLLGRQLLELPVTAEVADTISVGGYMTCGLNVDNSMWCFGACITEPCTLSSFPSDTAASTNLIDSGALVGVSLIPVQVFPEIKWSSVAAGGLHTCGIKTDGTAWCFGNNELTQLGLGPAGASTPTTAVPIEVPGNGTYVKITAGGIHSCGIRTDGSVSCWGSNAYGQLGNQYFFGDGSAVDVFGGHKFADICTGTNTIFTCGVSIEGTILCWGDNTVPPDDTSGQGSVTFPSPSSFPVETQSGADWKKLTCGKGFLCAIKQDGTLYCWGNNACGNIGDGTFEYRTGPVLVGDPTLRWVDVEASFDACTVCAITDTSNLYCWGGNDKGQVGDGTTTNQPSPVQIPNMFPVAQVSTRYATTCAIMASNNEARCWGSGQNGQIGDGTTSDHPSPTTVVGNLKWKLHPTDSQQIDNSLFTFDPPTDSGTNMTPIIAGVVAGVLVIGGGIIGFIVYKKRSKKADDDEEGVKDEEDGFEARNQTPDVVEEDYVEDSVAQSEEVASEISEEASPPEVPVIVQPEPEPVPVVVAPVAAAAAIPVIEEPVQVEEEESASEPATPAEGGLSKAASPSFAAGIGATLAAAAGGLAIFGKKKSESEIEPVPEPIVEEEEEIAVEEEPEPEPEPEPPAAEPEPPTVASASTGLVGLPILTIADYDQEDDDYEDNESIPPTPMVPQTPRLPMTRAELAGDFTMDQVTIIRLIADGVCGKVYLATINGKEYALRMLVEEGSRDAAARTGGIHFRYKQNPNLLVIKHPFVVQYAGLCTIPPCIAVEYCSRGSLYDLIKASNTTQSVLVDLTWDKRINLAIDAAKGMLHLHTRYPPLVHGALKSSNLLICDDWKVKVGDVNLRLLLDGALAKTKSRTIPLDMRWVAPEVMRGQKPQASADSYSFGVILWSLMTCIADPWEGKSEEELNQIVRLGEKLPLPPLEALPNMPKDVVTQAGWMIQLIAECTALDPLKRPDFKEILDRLRARHKYGSLKPEWRYSYKGKGSKSIKR